MKMLKSPSCLCMRMFGQTANAGNLSLKAGILFFFYTVHFMKLSHQKLIICPVSIVGSGAPLHRESARGDDKPPVHSAERRRVRQAPLADPTPIRAGLGSGRLPRPGEVLFLLNEDTHSVEKSLPCGCPRSYCAAPP